MINPEYNLFIAIMGRKQGNSEQLKETVDGISLKQAIENLLGTIPTREATVLRLYFGLNASEGEGKTLREIGNRFEVTESRIGQIKNKALRKLRHPSRSRILKQYAEGGGE